jgi:hypothetical protein
MCKFWTVYKEVFEFVRCDRGEFRNTDAYELTRMYSVEYYVNRKCSCVLCLRVNTAVVCVAKSVHIYLL